MRVLGLDYGARRIGVAISDATGTLARPLTTLAAAGAVAIERIAALAAELGRDEDGVGLIVVGLPRRLDGTPHGMTDRVRAFAAALEAATGLRVLFQDERLSSHEAEGRLAERHRSWQRRKQLLDAAAAAVILQDYLDERARHRQAGDEQP